MLNILDDTFDSNLKGQRNYGLVQKQEHCIRCDCNQNCEVLH